MFSKYPSGTLNVTIIEARKLHGEDLIGKNDPYVELWVDDDYKQRTTTISNTNDPVWNQTFTFPLNEGRKHKLYLKVFDKDTIGSDTIGEAKFDFESAFNGVPIDTWVKLPAKLGLTSHGEVHIYLQFFPSN
ncbi:C2 domain-containing protein [Cokeromyces recurvatus]|uniref:C2 domain-containing protein n=1 Tax=Cokeromyces recurvatus TaxID=90255 RepID=UPI002220F4D9|nr:C2 domain-containing protein [Cokeromyces recurvatus]KAI7898187.1 C2 domain-containing protein [Cokeromyces recurvatus]